MKELYTNHEVLETILTVETDVHGRIARWMDHLTEYNYKVYHRLCKTNIIKIADGLSQMPGQYSQFVVAADLEQIALITTCHPTEPPNKQSIDLPTNGFEQKAQSHRSY